MLKFIKHHLSTIDGVAIWPTLSFVLFFAIFLGVLWWVFTVDRRHIDHMANAPLNRNEPDAR
jgi:cbb3-type cytochrome oxidase subunit 3